MNLYTSHIHMLKLENELFSMALSAHSGVDLDAHSVAHSDSNSSTETASERILQVPPLNFVCFLV